MKAFLNLEFEDGGELREFMERYLGPRTPPIDVIITRSASTTPLAEMIERAEVNVEPVPPQEQLARTRKPRSDAGQPRGPNKTTTETAGAGTPGGTGASPGVSTTLTPLAPTTPHAAPPSAAATTAPAGAGAVKLTEAHARAELKKISTEPGMGGTQAAIDYIKKFGVHQITKLPESMYEQFIAGVDKEIAAFRAKPKAAK